MDAKAAVATAKQYVRDLFSEEDRKSRLGGFPVQRGRMREVRSYKIVKIRDSDAQLVALESRDRTGA